MSDGARLRAPSEPVGDGKQREGGSGEEGGKAPLPPKNLLTLSFRTRFVYRFWRLWCVDGCILTLSIQGR